MFTIEIKNEQGVVIETRKGEEFLLVVGTPKPDGVIGSCASMHGDYPHLLRLYLSLGVNIYRFQTHLFNNKTEEIEKME